VAKLLGLCFILLIAGHQVARCTERAFVSSCLRV
jgi:hypothetical protein